MNPCHQHHQHHATMAPDEPRQCSMDGCTHAAAHCTAFCSKHCALAFVRGLKECARPGCQRLQHFGLGRGDALVCFPHCGLTCALDRGHEETLVTPVDMASDTARDILGHVPQEILMIFDKKRLTRIFELQMCSAVMEKHIRFRRGRKAPVETHRWRFHGTRVECQLKEGEVPCDRPGCSVCQIIRKGFLMEFCHREDHTGTLWLCTRRLILRLAGM
jgi:hypothetical protein